MTMAAEFSYEQLAKVKKMQSLDLQTSHWAEKVKRAQMGRQVDSTFRSRLEALVKSNFESGGLKSLSQEQVNAIINEGGASKPKLDTMSQLAALGRINEATYLNVSHVTGDSFLVKSALNVYRGEHKDEDVEPVQPIDEQFGGNA